MRLYLVSYDVSTKEKAGQRRLRRVATLCEGYGCRVQKSVFECRVTKAQFETFRTKLFGLIDEEEDSIRMYRILEPLEAHREVFGRDLAIDFTGPLIF